MFKKMKNKIDNFSMKSSAKLMTSMNKSKKGDTQLIVLVLLLVLVAVAIGFFRTTFMDLFNQAMNKLKDTFNNIINGT